MKNLIVILGIGAVAWLGFLALRQQGDGKSSVSVQGLGVQIAIDRQVDPNNNPKPSNAFMSYWTCYHNGQPLPETIGIWWGHNPEDAEWACKNWISVCGNGGGCKASKISQ